MPDPDTDDEGCLSVPGESFPTGRAKWARVTGLDADGSPVSIEGTGLFARMLQHETGHLDGFLYLDRLIGRYARNAKRAVKSHGWAFPDCRGCPARTRPVRSLMVSWPGLGTRVTVRYRRPAGSMPPLTDAVGRLLAVDPTVRVQTKTGTIVEFSPVDVVALRVLTDAPVRTAAIRALEHAAAAAWPGVERTWLDGWLLRAGHGAVLAANSAVPLDISAHTNTITEISAWYASRDLQPWLAVPDRLLPLPAGLAGERREQVLVRDVSTGEPDRSVTLLDHPDDTWLRLYHQRLPLDMATPVIDGELAFGSYLGVAVARAAVTDAPDGARWVGMSAMRAADEQSATGSAGRQLWEALLGWGAGRGATRGYVRVHDTATSVLAESLGFRLHHHCRYLPAQSVGWDTF